MVYHSAFSRSSRSLSRACKNTHKSKHTTYGITACNTRHQCRQIQQLLIDSSKERARGGGDIFNYTPQSPWLQRAGGQKSRQQVEMEMKWNGGGGKSLGDIFSGFFLLNDVCTTVSNLSHAHKINPETAADWLEIKLQMYIYCSGSVSGCLSVCLCVLALW